MVKPKDIALDPASNTIYVSEGGIGFEPTILLSATSTLMVMYSIKERGSL